MWPPTTAKTSASGGFARLTPTSSKSLASFSPRRLRTASACSRVSHREKITSTRSAEPAARSDRRYQTPRNPSRAARSTTDGGSGCRSASAHRCSFSTRKLYRLSRPYIVAPLAVTVGVVLQLCRMTVSRRGAQASATQRTTREAALSAAEGRSRGVRRSYLQYVAQITPAAAARYVQLLISLGTTVRITTSVQGVATHPEDDLILATALSVRPDYLVTRHRRLRDRVPRFGESPSSRRL